MSDLGKRVVVAVIGAPVALAVIWFGDAALATLASMFAAVSAWEFFRISRAAGHAPFDVLGTIGSALVPLAVHAHYLGVFSVPLTVPILAVLALIAVSIFWRGVNGKPLAAIAITVFGIVYTGATLSFIYALRYYGYAVGDVAGAVVVILPVMLTWASDIGAYFAGRAIGGRKLLPSVSPGKTVAGAIGGVVFTTVVVLVFERYALRPYAHLAFTMGGAIVFGVSISVVAQIGDLAESLFKREANVKDSGNLLPGHGGALDRLDSLFFVLPVAYVLYGWLVIVAPS